MSFLDTLKELAEKAPPEHHAEAFAEQLALNVTDELRTLRKRLGLTQQELADRIGVKQSAIARLESATRMPSMKTLQRYALGLDASIVLGVSHGDVIRDATPGRRSTELRASGRFYYEEAEELGTIEFSTVRSSERAEGAFALPVDEDDVSGPNLFRPEFYGDGGREAA